MAGGNKLFKTSRKVNLIEAIIYQEAIQVPQIDEAPKTQHCMHEIERESETGISAVGCPIAVPHDGHSDLL